MPLDSWKKLENEAGFPYYICDSSSVRQWDHPKYMDVMSKVSIAADVKYAVYRMAYKLIYLQEQLKVPDVTLINGVFARHCLSLSENTFVLDPCEIEAILTDIYFAANKKGEFDGNVDLATELTLNFLLNVYDRERTSSVSVQSAKTCLALLCNSNIRDVWSFLFSTITDHNGCIRPRRLSSLLTQISALTEYLGEGATYGKHAVQAEVDKCFAKTPGMLGLSEAGLLQWLEAGPALLNWVHVGDRLRALTSSQITTNNNVTVWKCSLCGTKNPSGLKFKCTRCWGMMVCEKCYLYGESKSSTSTFIHRHNKTHVVKEMVDSQAIPSQCMVGLLRTIKKVLNCPTNCRSSNQVPSNVQYPLQGNTQHDAESKAVISSTNEHKKPTNDENRNPKVFTSTVGKACGKRVTDPRTILQDIITQLESQNKSLMGLSSVLNEVGLNCNSNMDRRLQHQVDHFWGQISIQINRLKMLKENLIPTANNIEFNKTYLHPQDSNVKMETFEMFSPIPVVPKECFNESTILEHKNIISDNDKMLGSDNASTYGKSNRTEGVVPRTIQYYDDSITRVSMNDISTWFCNETNTDNKKHNGTALKDSSSKSCSGDSGGSASLEDKFNADLDCVASSNNKMKELNADLDSVLDRLQSILANNFTLDDTLFDNTQLKETANEMEGLLGTLIRGVEKRRTIQRADKI